MPYLVFISHAGADIWAAWHLSEKIEKLKKLGVTYFLDQLDIAGGAEFEQKILDALQAAGELWVILSPNSLSRCYVWLEVGAAWFKNIPITPIAIGMTSAEVVKSNKLPLALKKRQIVEASNLAAYQQFLADFKERMRQRSRPLPDSEPPTGEPQPDGKPPPSRPASAALKPQTALITSASAPHSPRTTAGRRTGAHPTNGRGKSHPPPGRPRAKKSKPATTRRDKKRHRNLGRKKPR